MSEKRFFVVITERMFGGERAVSANIVVETDAYNAAWVSGVQHSNWPDERIIDVVDCGTAET